MFSNPEVRKWAYVAQAIIGAGLVTLVAAGLITQEISDTATAVVGGLLGLLLAGNGTLATKNTTSTPKITKADVQTITDALTEHAAQVAQSAIPAYRQVAEDAQDALDQVLAEARKRLGR